MGPFIMGILRVGSREKAVSKNLLFFFFLMLQMVMMLKLVIIFIKKCFIAFCSSRCSDSKYI